MEEGGGGGGRGVAIPEVGVVEKKSLGKQDPQSNELLVKKERFNTFFAHALFNK